MKASWMVLVGLGGCALVDDPGLGVPCDTGVATTPEPAGLTAEEEAGLATWGDRSVVFELSDGTGVTGDELGVLFPALEARELDVISTMTRAQDYNSSRSNNSSVVELDDDLDGDDDGDGLQIWWDGVRCVALPCLSGGREREASRRLRIVPGTSLDDGALSVRWAETTPADVTFTGSLAIGCKVPSCHVTVLKAVDNGDGGVDLYSCVDEGAVWVMERSSTDPLFEGKTTCGTSPLATVSGTEGSSWPSGVRISETAVGTLVSFTW